MSVRVSVLRLALWLRLLVVCLVLTGVSAPPAPTGYREAVVAVAIAAARVTARAPAKQPAAADRAPQRPKPALVAWPAPIVAHIEDGRSPAPPRRLFLINSALLC